MRILQRGIERCQLCRRVRDPAEPGWTFVENRWTCNLCMAIPPQDRATVYDLAMYAMLPIRVEFLRRNDLVRHTGHVFRVRSDPRVRPGGWKVSVQRMDTANKSGCYLYFRSDEIVCRMLTIYAANQALEKIVHEQAHHDDAPVMRLLRDEIGDIAYRVDATQGAYLRVSGRWSPSPWLSAWHLMGMTTDRTGGRVWHVAPEDS